MAPVVEEPIVEEEEAATQASDQPADTSAEEGEEISAFEVEILRQFHGVDFAAGMKKVITLPASREASNRNLVISYQNQSRIREMVDAGVLTLNPETNTYVLDQDFLA